MGIPVYLEPGFLGDPVQERLLVVHGKRAGLHVGRQRDPGHLFPGANLKFILRKQNRNGGAQRRLGGEEKHHPGALKPGPFLRPSLPGAPEGCLQLVPG